VDIERVLALKPDLILGWRSGNPVRDLERLDRLGFRVVVTEPRRLPDISGLLRMVGALAGTEVEAEMAARRIESELDALREKYGSRRPLRVFYEIWHRPLLTINGAHIISDIIEVCGGRNVFADAPVLTPAISYEAVLAMRPDVILGGSSAARPEELARMWQRIPVATLRKLPVRHVPPDLIQRQGPRIVEGARAVCEQMDAVRAGREQ
jgi:iron complex transport system substrate-binding protein